MPRALRLAPRELWLVFFLKLTGSLAYFACSIVFVRFLKEDFGASDSEAGTWYGIWGLLASLMALVCGPLIDRMRIRKSLVLGSLLGALSCVVLALSHTYTWAKLVLCTTLPFSTALGIPVLTIAVKRYTNTTGRERAFGIFYAIMNVGAVLAGPCIDAIRYSTGGAVHYRAYSATYPRVVFFLSAVVLLVNALVALAFVRPVIVRDKDTTGVVFLRKTNATNEDERRVSIDDRDADKLLEDYTQREEARVNCCRLTGNARSAWLLDKWRQFRAIVTDRHFWRLAVFNMAMTPVNMIFRHMDATLPTWLIRTMGDNVPFGSYYSIDPFCVIFLSILFPIVLGRYAVYSRMVVGSAISALSVFILAMQASTFSVVLFGVVLSVGESLYSPLIYSFTMSLAPREKEGAYAALSTAPLFTTKLFVGKISGGLLARYCPSAADTSQCSLVWVWIAGISLATPLLLLLVSRFVHSDGVKISLDQLKDGSARENNNDDDDDPLTRIERGIDSLAGLSKSPDTTLRSSTAAQQ